MSQPASGDEVQPEEPTAPSAGPERQHGDPLLDATEGRDGENASRHGADADGTVPPAG